jgi:hypothetical protein
VKNSAGLPHARPLEVLRCPALAPVRALAFDGVQLLEACDNDNAFGYAVTRALLKVVARRLHATRIQLLDVYTPLSAKSMKV